MREKREKLENVIEPNVYRSEMSQWNLSICIFNVHALINIKSNKNQLKYPKIHRETLKTLNSESHREQEEQTWQYHITQSTVTLAFKQAARRWSRIDPRNKFTHLHTTQKGANISWGNKNLFNKCCWENYVHIQKNKLDPVSLP